MILVRSDGSELGFCKGECLEVLSGVRVFVPGIDVNHVKSGLITMHRVQNHLKRESQIVLFSQREISIFFLFELLRIHTSKSSYIGRA